MLASTADQEDDRTPVGISFAKDSPKSAADLSPPQDARNFEMGRKPIQAHGRAGSGGVALIRPHKNSRESIAAARAAHFFQRSCIARDPADRGKCFQVLCACVDR